MIHYFTIFITIFTLFIHNINANAFQEKNIALHDHLIITLQKELKTTHYKKEILPNDFSYFTQLITFGTVNHQSATYLRSIIKLFSNMLKSSPYVNAYAFSTMLETLPAKLTPYFTFPISQQYISQAAIYDASFIDRFKTTVQTILYSKFSSDYESFIQDPDMFLNQINSTIVTVAQEELIQEQLRQAVIRFCEIALQKLIWDPLTKEETWTITKKIAEQLASLLTHNILDDTNDLDDLYWSLLSRYCYFIELMATDMPQSFYKEIKRDINTHNIVLFALKEQDDLIESKLSYMQRTLLEAETALYCYKTGLNL